MRADEVIRRGEWADQALNNPAFQEAMKSLHDKIFAEYRKTNLFQVRKREQVFRLLRASDIFEAELKKYLSDMAVEKDKLNKPKIKKVI